MMAEDIDDLLNDVVLVKVARERRGETSLGETAHLQDPEAAGTLDA